MSLLINVFYKFGEFNVDTEQRVLLRHGKPVPLTPKVFDTLLILVENGGRIVEKEELMNRLWPDTFVEEANLTFNIRQLRRSLGDDARNPHYIETVARRGYRFIADVEEFVSEKVSTSDQAARQIEAHEDPSRHAESEFVNEARALAPQSSATPEDQSSARQSEQSATMPSSPAVSTTPSKRSIALVAAAMLVLAAIVIAIWELSTRSNRGLSDNNGVPAGALAPVPLKLEKLTGSGQSGLVAISPDARFLAYTQTIKKEPGIWLRQFTTNANIEIVPPTGPVYALSFANKDEYLYFTKGVPTALYRVSIHGGVPSRLVEGLRGKFSISPDDSQVAFVRRVIDREGRQEDSLMVGDLGGGERALFKVVYPDEVDTPVWAPDGQSIVCSYGNSEAGGLNTSIVEIGVAGGTKRGPSSEKFSFITKIAWLPHKAGLIVSARKNLGDSNQLWRLSYPSMEIRQITEGLFYYHDLSIAAGLDKAVASQATRISDIWIGSSPESKDLKKVTQAIDNFCWTPDRRLVYSSTASGNRDLWIMQPNGTEQRQLTANGAVNGTPAITTDNRYIVFMSNRTGPFQIWRMNIDGSNQIQLTDGGTKNFPAITPDGKWVLFNSTDRRLWKVSIEGGEAVRLTDYPAGYPSVSPDGKTIACVGTDEIKLRRSILVLPFEGGQPMKAIEPAGTRISGFRVQWAGDGKALIYAAERNGTISIIRQSLSNGVTKETVSFSEDELFDFGYSPDGKFFAVTRGGWQHDIVLISDINRF